MTLSPQFEIQLVAIVVAVSCALPGVFLVLRRMAMMTDAITHTVLLGIILGFLIAGDVESPLLVIGATLVGVVTVVLVEMLTKTRRMSEDSAIGIIFPLLFSIAIVLISRYAGKAHIDTDSVLLGELAFVPFHRLTVGGADLGPKALYLAGIVLLINFTALVLFFKEIKLAVFDPHLAYALGFAPVLIHYGLMTSVSLTAVSAFEAVGSILVIAFMIGPPASAYLLTDDLKTMLGLSALIGGVNALVGYRVASWFDVSIAGSIALVTGLIFLLIFVFAPHRGMLSNVRRRMRQRVEFAEFSVLFHLHNHCGKANEAVESGVATIHEHLNMKPLRFRQVVDPLLKRGWVEVVNGVYCLTSDGRVSTEKIFERTFREVARK